MGQPKNDKGTKPPPPLHFEEPKLMKIGDPVDAPPLKTGIEFANGEEPPELEDGAWEQTSDEGDQPKDHPDPRAHETGETLAPNADDEEENSEVGLVQLTGGGAAFKMPHQQPEGDHRENAQTVPVASTRLATPMSGLDRDLKPGGQPNFGAGAPRAHTPAEVEQTLRQAMGKELGKLIEAKEDPDKDSDGQPKVDVTPPQGEWSSAAQGKVPPLPEAAADKVPGTLDKDAKRPVSKRPRVGGPQPASKPTGRPSLAIVPAPDEDLTTTIKMAAPPPPVPVTVSKPVPPPVKRPEVTMSDSTPKGGSAVRTIAIGLGVIFALVFVLAIGAIGATVLGVGGITVSQLAAGTPVPTPGDQLGLTPPATAPDDPEQPGVVPQPSPAPGAAPVAGSKLPGAPLSCDPSIPSEFRVFMPMHGPEKERVSYTATQFFLRAEQSRLAKRVQGDAGAEEFHLMGLRAERLCFLTIDASTSTFLKDLVPYGHGENAVCAREELHPRTKQVTFVPVDGTKAVTVCTDHKGKMVFDSEIIATLDGEDDTVWDELDGHPGVLVRCDERGRRHNRERAQVGACRVATNN